MALTKISTDGVKDDAVTTDKLANAINTERTGKIANVVEDTSPQLGGDLDTNSFEISLDDDHKVKFGASDDLYIWHNSSTGNSNVTNINGNLYLQGNNGSGTAQNQIAIISNAAVELNYQGAKKLETYENGIRLNGAETGAQFQLGAGNDFQIEHDGTNSYIYNLTNDLVIQNDAGIKITAKSGGTQRFRFDSDGLKFGTDTAAANALDDYEEGTWTPGITIGGGTTGIVYSNQLGYYTKIGRLVHASCYLQLTNAGSGTGVLYLTGLPFTPLDATGARASGSVGWYTGLGGAVDHPILLLVEQNDTSFPMRHSGSTGANNMVHSDIGNSFGIFYNLTYIH